MIGSFARIASFVAGALLMLAYFYVRPDWWIAVFGFVLLLYGVAGDTLVEISVGRNGLLAKFQREVLQRLPGAMERQLEDRVTMTDSSEAKVTRGGSLSTAAVIGDKPKSPDEFAELVATQVVGVPTIHGQGQAFPPTVATEEQEDAPKEDAQ